MKKAKVQKAIMFYLACPHCGEGVSNTNDGSFNWIDDDFNGEENSCDDSCGKIFQNPTQPPKRVNTYIKYSRADFIKFGV